MPLQSYALFVISVTQPVVSFQLLNLRITDPAITYRPELRIAVLRHSYPVHTTKDFKLFKYEHDFSQVICRTIYKGVQDSYTSLFHCVLSGLVVFCQLSYCVDVLCVDAYRNIYMYSMWNLIHHALPCLHFYGYIKQCSLQRSVGCFHSHIIKKQSQPL